MKKSVLYVISVPIGNIGDISLRALSLLSQTDIIVCENVGQTTALMRHLGLLEQHYSSRQPVKDKIQTKVKLLIKELEPVIKITRKPHFIAYESYKNPSHLVQEVINLMKTKKVIVSLVSTAGTPLLSDPGLSLVKAAQEENFEIHPIPGASAILSGLVVSGFNLNYYSFLGMLPKNSKQRKKLLRDWLEVKLKNITLIAYISKYQLIPALKDLLAVNSDREIFLANDLTKFNEQGYKGKTSELIKYLENKPGKNKGEWLIVFSNAKK